MIPLDMRTVVLGYFATNVLIAFFIARLYLLNRQRYAGLGFWLIDFVLQALGILLLALRNVVPDLVSIVLAQTLIAAGALCLYIGLERFVGKPSSQLYNIPGVGAFAALMAYFTFVQPNFDIRSILVAVVILVLLGQCSWLLLRRVAPSLRSITRDAGLVSLLYVLAAAAQILVLRIAPLPAATGLFDVTSWQAVFALTNQLLCIALTFSLSLMVTRRMEQDIQVRVAERELAQVALHLSEARYRAVAHSANDAIISADSAGNVVDWNSSAEQMFGYLKSEVMGQPLTFVLPLRYQDAHAAGITRMQADGERHIIGKMVQVEGRHRDGHEIPLELSVAEWRVANEQFYTAIIRDITTRMQTEEKMRAMSFHDELTGLYNNRFFEQEMTRLAHERQCPVSIVMADLNGLKETNDLHGHAAGDALLRRAAQLLKDTFRAQDIVARMGGDEFVVLLPNSETATAQEALHRLQAALDRHNALYDGSPLSIAWGVSTAAPGRSLIETLKEADARMYQAKQMHYQLADGRG